MVFSKSSHILILIGNIASGKTTYCSELVLQNYVVLSCDALRYMIGNKKYIFNNDLEPIIQESIFDMYKAFQYTNYNIVVDGTNMSILSRHGFFYHKFARYKIGAIVFKERNMNESVQSCLAINHRNTTKEIWEEVWKRKNSQFEYPTIQEGFNFIKEVV